MTRSTRSNRSDAPSDEANPLTSSPVHRSQQQLPSQSFTPAAPRTQDPPSPSPVRSQIHRTLSLPTVDSDDDDELPGDVGSAFQLPSLSPFLARIAAASQLAQETETGPNQERRQVESQGQVQNERRRSLQSYQQQNSPTRRTTGPRARDSQTLQPQRAEPRAPEPQTKRRRIGRGKQPEGKGSDTTGSASCAIEAARAGASSSRRIVSDSTPRARTMDRPSNARSFSEYASASLRMRQAAGQSSVARRGENGAIASSSRPHAAPARQQQQHQQPESDPLGGSRTLMQGRMPLQEIPLWLAESRGEMIRRSSATASASDGGNHSWTAVEDAEDERVSEGRSFLKEVAFGTHGLPSLTQQIHTTSVSPPVHTRGTHGGYGARRRTSATPGSLGARLGITTSTPERSTSRAPRNSSSASSSYIAALERPLPSASPQQQQDARASSSRVTLDMDLDDSLDSMPSLAADTSASFADSSREAPRTPEDGRALVRRQQLLTTSMSPPDGRPVFAAGAAAAAATTGSPAPPRSSLKCPPPGCSRGLDSEGEEDPDDPAVYDKENTPTSTPSSSSRRSVSVSTPSSGSRGSGGASQRQRQRAGDVGSDSPGRSGAPRAGAAEQGTSAAEALVERGLVALDEQRAAGDARMKDTHGGGGRDGLAEEGGPELQPQH